MSNDEPPKDAAECFIQRRYVEDGSYESSFEADERKIATSGRPSTQQIIEHLEKKEPGDVIDVLQKAETALERVELLIQEVEEETEASRLGPLLSVSTPEDEVQARLRSLLARRDLSKVEKRAAEEVKHRPRGDSDRKGEVSSRTIREATETQLKHLETAKSVLDEQPEISKKREFKDVCMEKDEPGGSVRRRVQELGKKRLDMVHLPSHYTGFDGGFQRLVEDLWTDDLEK